MLHLQTITLAVINCLEITELIANNLLLYTVNKNQFNLFMMCSFFNNLLTVTGFESFGSYLSDILITSYSFSHAFRKVR